jgi:hypothetical protein
MYGIRVGLTLGSFLFVAAVGAQDRKAGLWEMTTNQSGATHTSLVCLTQQQIDKYGAPLPAMRGCQITNLVKKANGMSAEMVCTGTMNGKVTMESTSSDSEHAKGKVHFAGSVQAGPNSRPVEWTIESASVFKGPSCGDVKPVAMPDK